MNDHYERIAKDHYTASVYKQGHDVGYAEALRDLAIHLYGEDAFTSKTHGMVTLRMIRNFAAERGIDLDDVD